VPCTPTDLFFFLTCVPVLQLSKYMLRAIYSHTFHLTATFKKSYLKNLKFAKTCLLLFSTSQQIQWQHSTLRNKHRSSVPIGHQTHTCPFSLIFPTQYHIIILRCETMLI
jgi:hypothetical protein